MMNLFKSLSDSMNFKIFCSQSLIGMQLCKLLQLSFNGLLTIIIDICSFDLIFGKYLSICFLEVYAKEDFGGLSSSEHLDINILYAGYPIISEIVYIDII